MISGEDIASKATPAFRYTIERPFSDEDVAATAWSVVDTRTLVDLKVLAYAHHIGVMAPAELLTRLGDPKAVVTNLSSLLKSLETIDQNQLTAALSGGVAGFAVRPMGRTQDEGWAFTLFDMLHQSGLKNWYAAFEADDPARIGIRWALQGALKMAEASAVVAMWARKGDALHIAAAGMVVLESIEHELVGVATMIDISGLERLPRAVIGGRIFATLIQREKNLHNLPAERRQLLENLITRLKPDVTSWVQSPKDLETFIESGKRNDSDLISFLLTLPLGPRVRIAAEREAESLLKRAFQRVATRSELDGNQLMFVAGWMINPLAHAAIQIGIGTDFYAGLLDNLAFDEYAYSFDHALYLNDRVRAILLCAIGAIVAVQNGELDVGILAQEAVEVLGALPQGSVTVFADVALEELHTRFGIALPAQ